LASAKEIKTGIAAASPAHLITVLQVQVFEATEEILRSELSLARIKKYDYPWWTQKYGW
jgi:hypothetical protein